MKQINILFSICLFSAVLFGCHTQQNLASGWDYQASHSGVVIMSEASDVQERDGFDTNNEAIDRKVLYTAYLALTVAQPDSTNVDLALIAKKYKGYVSQLGSDRTIIRVESHQLNDAIQDISVLGRVEHKNISGQDVTEDYLDFQIRLENAEKARKRYLELLDKAENVEAALKVEKELERLNGAIDLLKGKMSRMNHLSEFSTITITLKEKKKPGIIGYVGIGFYRAAKWLFVRN